MLNMRDIIDYGPCYMLAINCPADGIDLPRKATLFDVYDSATHETRGTFRTAAAAKKFAHHYIADPEGTMQRQRMVSGDRLTHVRALWAVSLLSNWINCDLIITDKRNPHAELEHYEVNEIYTTRFENEIMVRYYIGDEIEAKFMYISGIKAVRAISENTFAFETYTGKVYTIRGID